MAYDKGLAERVRNLLEEHPAFSERRMFGGIAFMLFGKMVAGVVREDLMVRAGPEAYSSALNERDARPMDFTGKPMKGFVIVQADALDSDQRLEWWVDIGVRCVQRLAAQSEAQESSRHTLTAAATSSSAGRPRLEHQMVRSPKRRTPKKAD